MIRASSLSKRYGDLQALSDVSLHVAAGEVVVVLGPSGAGKSTLLRCINHLTEPSSGEVFIAGERIPDKLSGLRRVRSQIGMIFQDHNLIGRMTVVKNVLAGRLAFMPMIASLFQLFPREDVEFALACLKRVDLDDRAWTRADRLSGGQQQRVGIARALAQRPRAILADEPVASLDPTSAGLVLDDLRRAAHDLGIAVVCNLHQVNYARQYADRIVGMRRGKVVFEGTVRELDDSALASIYPDSDRADVPSAVAGLSAA